MVTIILYKYNGRRNVVNKTLNSSITLNGTLKDYFNYLKPTITVRLDNLHDSNYCYISSFNRYYFIDDVIVRNDGTFELVLSIDVLKTYEYEILGAKGQTILTENPNKYSSNRNSTFNVQPNFEKIPFDNENLLSETGSIIMITIKGSSDGN